MQLLGLSSLQGASPEANVRDEFYPDGGGDRSCSGSMDLILEKEF